MAITAKFGADFSNFTEAVRKAEASLKGFEEDANKVQKSLNRMGDAFSGKKIIQDAQLMEKAIHDLGGASTLTANEAAKVNRTITEAIAKYRALGQEAPAALHKLAADTAAVDKATGAATTSTASWMTSLKGAAGALGIAFSVGAVKQWVTQTLAAAGQIDDLSKKLGVSAEAVQRWRFAAEQGGATIEHVDKAVNVMNRSLAEGDKSTISALKAAGLSFADIRAMKPEDAFNAITSAIGKMPDPMERARVAMELFGKGGAELLPAIVDNFADVAAGATVMADETVKRLAAAEDAWARLSTNATIYTGEFLGGVIEQSENWIATVERMTGSWAKFVQTAQVLAVGSLSGFGGVQDAMKALAELEKQQAGAGKPQQSDAERRKGIEDAVARAKSASEQAAADKKAEKAADDYAAALKRLNEVIRPLTDSQRQRVDAWLAEGKSISDMAKVLRVNEIAVQNYKKEQDELDKILEKGIGSVLGLGDAYKQMGQQMAATDGIVSTLMVNIDKLNDSNLFGISAPQIQLGIPELPKEIKEAADELDRLENVGRTALSNLGQSFADLSSVADGALGSIAGAFADVIGAIEQARAAAAAFRDGMGLLSSGAGLSGILSMASGILGIASAAIAAGKAIGGMFRDLDHEKVNDLRDTFLLEFGPGGTGTSSGFGRLAAQLHELGSAGDAMFQRLINAKKVDEFQAAMKAIEDALGKANAAKPENLAAAAGFATKAQLQAMADAAVKVHAYMRDSGLYTAEAVQQAWERANEALIKSGDAAAVSADKAKAALDAMGAELKGLYDSIADEAPEEDMGVIERNTRARIAQIEAEMEARKVEIAEEERARKEANENAADHLQKILSEREFVARLKFDYELPEGLTQSIPGFAGGTHGKYLDFGKGTLAMLHGKEKIVRQGDSAGDSVGGYMPVSIEIDGENIVKAVVKVRKRTVGV